MAVKAINTLRNARSEYSSQKKNNKNNGQNTSFTGFPNPLVPVTMVMDAVDRGGFAASFIIQDGIGMVAPRIKEGLNRNRKREKDPITGEETGRRTGPLNWQFARREGIREILSGPSAFLIPMAMLGVIKKASGSANNVRVDHINALGKTFANFAENNSDLIMEVPAVSQNSKNTFFKKLLGTNLYNKLNPEKNISPAAKSEYYTRVFKNVLGASLDNKLNGAELERTAREFTHAYMVVEKAPSKGFWKTFIGKSVDGSKEDLKDALIGRYMNLRKNLLNSSINEHDAVIPVEGSNKKVHTNFTRVLDSMTDYTDDILNNSKKYIDTHGQETLRNYIKTLNQRRAGTRIFSIASMFAAVVAFYTIIPKLYNLGLKHDPGLNGLEEENPTALTQQTQQKTVSPQTKEVKSEKAADTVDKTSENVDTPQKDKNQTDKVAFTGAVQTAARKVGKTVSNNDLIQKAVNKFEFSGPSMSVPAMLTLLFGFCLPPRYKNAKSDKEKKEILVRDISSFIAILFGANALSRLASVGLSKISGLVLNVKPEDHNKSIFHQVKNYFTPGKGITLLKGGQIAQKYSNLEGFKDRIVGFVDFIQGEGGNIKRLFRMDKALKANVETILGKPLKETSISEIRNALKAADDQLLAGSESAAAKSMKNIYQIFGPNNKFIKMAKHCNSAISAMATLVLTPLFMISVARYCERMTKKRVEEEKAAKAAEMAKNMPALRLRNMAQNVMPSQRPSMTGFLDN